MTTLRFAEGLDLPMDAVTQKFAFLGRTGSGKTYGAKRLVESLLGARAQVVILDPVGIWHGLRVGKVSFEVPVLGGLHGDLPIASTSGAAVARVVSERSLSMVIDVSQMLDAERTRFAESFAREFFQLKKAAPSPVMLVLEEMQEFAPQNPNPGEQMMPHEFQRIAKLGRNFGIGLLGISQRPQECNKKVLNQAECVVAFQMTGPQERKALEYWLSDRGIESKDLGKLLPTLEVGKPLLWSPQWLKRREVIEILPIDTSDTSRTPKFGTVASKFELQPARVDTQMLRAELETAIEEDAKNNPKLLRQRIQELERQLDSKDNDERKGPDLDPSELERFAQLLKKLTLERRSALESAESAAYEIGAAAKSLQSAMELIVGSDDGVIVDLERIIRDGSPAALASQPRSKRSAPPPSRPARSEPPRAKATKPPPSKAASGGLPVGERTMLELVAQRKGGVPRIRT